MSGPRAVRWPIHGSGPRAMRGMALVEVALVVPIMCLVLFAIAEFGRAFWQFNALAAAAADAAHFMAARVLPDSTGVVNLNGASGTLLTQGRNIAVCGKTDCAGGTPVVSGLNSAHVTITSPSAGQVKVAVAFPYAGIFGATLPSFGFGSNISTTFTLRVVVTSRAT